MFMKSRQKASRRFSNPIAPNALNLLFFDIITPRKNGQDAFTEISMMRPDVTAIFTGADTASLRRQRGFLDNGLALPTKLLSPVIGP